jgi:hypothetical protein
MGGVLRGLYRDDCSNVLYVNDLGVAWMADRASGPELDDGRP